MNEEINEIKTLLRLFIKHIRPDGTLYYFSVEEVQRMRKIVDKWIAEEKESE